MSVNKEKDWFTFRIVYFKESGKMGYTTFHNMEVTLLKNCGPEPKPYLYDAIDKIERLRENGRLPGLSSGNWDGYILIEHDGFPHLILPRGMQYVT